ncbi:MAG: leucine-rich repeat protein, partial [Clostridia bacterium]|nr:leucine-rich repeat protein [Clostridia bacterium]
MRRFNKIVAVLLCVIMMLGIAPLNGFVGLKLPDLSGLFVTKASASDSGTCGDNLTWEYDDSTFTLTISGTGEMFNYDYLIVDDYTPPAPWGQYYHSMRVAVISDGVTSIGACAFWRCTGLTSITIPNSVTNIGFRAFYYCGLTSINIPDSVTNIRSQAFYGCTGLTSVTIPDSVTSIDNSAFSGCSGLTSITIPDSVTSIGKDAFSNTAYYKNTDNWTDDILYIGNHLISAESTISGNIIIEDGIKSVADGAFYGCYSVTSVTIPRSVTVIDGYAFANCTSLTNITVCNPTCVIANDAIGSVTITGYLGSTAYDYAKSHGCNFVAIEHSHIDTDNDGLCDDCALALRGTCGDNLTWVFDINTNT